MSVSDIHDGKYVDGHFHDMRIRFFHAGRKKTVAEEVGKWSLDDEIEYMRFASEMSELRRKAERGRRLPSPSDKDDDEDDEDDLPPPETLVKSKGSLRRPGAKNVKGLFDHFKTKKDPHAGEDSNEIKQGPQKEKTGLTTSTRSFDLVSDDENDEEILK